MKKLVFGLMAFMLLSSSVFAQSVPPKDKPPLIELQFGRKSLDCAGFGICVFRVNLFAEDVAQVASAVLMFFRPDGHVKIQMGSDFYKRNAKSFQNGYLVLEEDFEIDRETMRAVGVSDPYTIKRGKYQVVFDKSTNTYNCTF